MRRLAILVFVLVLAAPAGAQAADQLAQGRHQMTLASQGVSDALTAYKAGDKANAYKLARDAYLDHFEFVEVPLRLRNPNLVLDTEFTFAELRNNIRSGASVSTVRGSVVKLRHQLLDVDRELAKKGIAAPIIAFAFSFTILFREGV
jgi:high-affinity iron transporter